MENAAARKAITDLNFARLEIRKRSEHWNNHLLPIVKEILEEISRMEPEWAVQDYMTFAESKGVSISEKKRKFTQDVYGNPIWLLGASIVFALGFNGMIKTYIQYPEIGIIMEGIKKDLVGERDPLKTGREDIIKDFVNAIGKLEGWEKNGMPGLSMPTEQ